MPPKREKNRVRLFEFRTSTGPTAVDHYITNNSTLGLTRSRSAACYSSISYGIGPMGASALQLETMLTCARSRIPIITDDDFLLMDEYCIE